MSRRRRQRPRPFRGSSPRFVVLSAWLGIAIAGSVGAHASGLSEPARQQLGAVLAEKASRTAAQRKIGSDLLYEIKRLRGDPLFNLVPTLVSHAPRAKNGLVEVDARASMTGRLLHLIESVGGVVVAVHPQSRAARLRVPLSALEDVAALDEVIALRRGETPVTRKVNTSEGDLAHGAQAARLTFGVDGTGVKVGVISDGVDSLGVVQASGDLPADVVVLPGQAGTGTEGTAMLEIIHDLAPGAELYFATAKPDREQLAQNVRDLASAGCDVIVDDIGYARSTVFQDGVVATAVEDVVAAGVLYFSAAGNGGNYSDGTSGTWEGDYQPSEEYVFLSPEVGDNSDGVLHDFGGTVTNTITAPAPNGVILQWSDPQGASDNDYDLCLLDAAGEVVLACSTNWQEGPGDDPYEELASAVEAGALLVILNFEELAETRFFHLSTFEGGALEVSTPGTICGQQAAAAAFAVAAVDVVTAAGGEFLGGDQNPVEAFSADGPRRIFYSATGAPITPGDFTASGGTLRQKPDVAAADGVSTATAGYETFRGTSAAAPHAAGLAALMKEMDPTLTPERARSIFADTALDIEEAGVDRDSGHGIIMAEALLAALGSPCESPSTPASLQTTNPAPASAESYVLSWGAAADADSYELQEATDPAFTAAVTFTVTGTSQSFSHSVASSTTYYYRVRASKDCGALSGWSGSVAVVVEPADCESPGAPSDLQSDLTSPASGESYTLSWSASADADSYQIEEATDPSFTGAQSTTVSVVSASYTHTVDETTAYYYRVRASRSCGSVSPWSATAQVEVTVSACSAPGQPKNFHSSVDVARSGETYTLDWDWGPGADGHELQESKYAGFSSPTVYYHISSTTQYLVKRVYSPATFYYRVRGTQTCGSESVWSPVIEVVVSDEDCPRPEMPSGVAASASVVDSGATYTIAWAADPDADYYQISEAQSPDFSGTPVLIDVQEPEWDRSQSVIDTTTFYYRVRSVRDCSSYSRMSEWTQAVSVTVNGGEFGGSYIYLVPGVAHTPGAQGTNWRASLSVFNSSETSASLLLTFRVGDGSTSKPAPLAPGQVLEWDDAVASLFGISGTAAGAVEVSSDVPVIVTARSYNASASGTFGQYMPACELTDTLSSGQVGHLPHLKSTDSFRTNIGLINLGPDPCTARITLYGQTGAQLGQPLTIEAAPGGWSQENDVFGKAEAGECAIGRATVELETADCSVWAYASVIDNATGDPTTIPLFVR